MTPVVELRAARKRFGQVEALRGVDLAIGTGELVALLGPNGAGKTTSISLMLGLRRPTGGEARLFGFDPADQRARSRCGGMLQESGTTGVLTVRELVDLFRSYYPSPMPTATAIARAGLDAKADARAGTLSGGERQRLHFALAVCGDPEALFLDEPTVGMDVETRRAVLESIRALSAGGKTIVLTTHYLEEADQLARRIIVIDHGVVIADATPREIKARIPSKRVSFSAGAPLGDAIFQGLAVQSLEVAGLRVRLLSHEPERVLKTLFERGVTVEDLEVRGADLEEELLSLPARGQRARPSRRCCGCSWPRPGASC